MEAAASAIIIIWCTIPPIHWIIDEALKKLGGLCVCVQRMHVLGSVYGLPAGCVKVSACFLSFDSRISSFLSVAIDTRKKEVLIPLVATDRFQ
jgi:hypothetical protein